MRLGGIGTRYAVGIAALTFFVVATALLAAGVIGFRGTRVVQAEIHAAVAAARTSDEEEALRGTAAYLGAHLFNALYRLDVELLNEEIEQVRSWLPVSTFLVIDKEGHVLTDGTIANERYGEAAPGPLPEGEPRSLLLSGRGEETEIRFTIASGGVAAGGVTLGGALAASRGKGDGCDVGEPRLAFLGAVAGCHRPSPSSRRCSFRPRSGLTEMSRAAAEIARNPISPHPRLPTSSATWRERSNDGWRPPVARGGAAAERAISRPRTPSSSASPTPCPTTSRARS
jgi:hypothetical protein